MTGYAEQRAVLIAAVASSLVGSVNGMLWPVLGVTGLGLVLVIIGGTLLGNYRENNEDSIDVKTFPVRLAGGSVEVDIDG